MLSFESRRKAGVRAWVGPSKTSRPSRRAITRSQARHVVLNEEAPRVAALADLAVLYAGRGEYEKARESLEMAIRTHPSYATAHENLGDVYAKLASQAGASLSDQAEQIAGATVLISQLPATEPKALRTMLDELKNKLSSGVILLATVNEDKISLIAGVTADLTGKVHAGQLVGWAAEKLGGKGGGRPDMAQAGGTDVTVLTAVLAEAKTLVRQKLS